MLNIQREFTEAALTLTRFVTPQTVLLWSGPEVEAALEQQKFRVYLLRKYRRFVHTGDPTLDARSGELQ